MTVGCTPSATLSSVLPYIRQYCSSLDFSSSDSSWDCRASVQPYLRGSGADRIRGVAGSHACRPVHRQAPTDLGVLCGWLCASFGVRSTSSTFRARLNRWTWSVRSLASDCHLYQLARFSHTLAMLLRGGVPFVNSLDMAVGLCSSRACKTTSPPQSAPLARDNPFRAAFARHGLATRNWRTYVGRRRTHRQHGGMMDTWPVSMMKNSANGSNGLRDCSNRC